VYDAARELRAEARARELMRSVVSPREFEMYEALGFLSVSGGQGPGYAYLIYPHLPLVAYDCETEELLSEYCVTFPDRESARESADRESAGHEAGSRLPDADDVLAKWIALHGSERELIATANMHLPGRQLDPERVRRDLIRSRGWRRRRTDRVEAAAA
jgi:hypothetical protein